MPTRIRKKASANKGASNNVLDSLPNGLFVRCLSSHEQIVFVFKGTFTGMLVTYQHLIEKVYV